MTDQSKQIEPARDAYIEKALVYRMQIEMFNRHRREVEEPLHKCRQELTDHSCYGIVFMSSDIFARSSIFPMKRSKHAPHAYDSCIGRMCSVLERITSRFAIAHSHLYQKIVISMSKS